MEDTRLIAWSYNQIGKVYDQQGMYEECIEPYRLYYQHACLTGDDRQIAQASAQMGTVYTYNSNVDSAIFCYMHAIELVNKKPYTSDVVSNSRERLADIYIQIEEFDSAAMFMFRDSANSVNWAYWHAGQHHLDSAIFYFKQSLKDKRLLARREIYQQLAELEQQRGNHAAALDDYQALYRINDSIKQQSLETETRQTQTQHEYQQLRQERDNAAFWSNVYLFGGIVLALLIAVLIFWGKSTMMTRKKLHEAELSQERQLRRSEEEKNQQSQNQLEANKVKIEQMEQQLSAALQQNNTTEANRLRLEKELLEARNRIIEVDHQRKAMNRREVEDSGLLERVRLKAGKDGFHLSEEEWHQLRQYIDATYSNFTRRLLNLAELSELEMQVCYLTKIGISTTDTAVMLYKTKSAISMMRKRMYYKLTRKQGSATDFESFILKF